MSEERPTFVVQPRSEAGKGVAHRLRAEGLIPAVCYGHGTDATSVTADPEALYKLLTGGRRTNTVFRLEIEDGTTHEYVMVRDYQIDPIRQHLVHADFVVVDPEKPLRVTLPVKAVGRPRGVREGGRLLMIRAEVPVLVAPVNIPVVVEYDVSGMGLGDTLLASQLDLGHGVEPAYKVDYAIASIIIPRGNAKGPEEEEAAAAPAAAAAAPEAAEEPAN